MTVQLMAQTAKRLAAAMAAATTGQKDDALMTLCALLKRHEELIMEANRQDLTAAHAAGLEDAMMDRLSLDGRLDGLCADLAAVAALPDPIGATLEVRHPPCGLSLTKVRTPLGVIGIIYESRPNVTVDVSALAIKSGNCALLRGGVEALRTNGALMRCVGAALQSVGLPEAAVQLLASGERGEVLDLLRMHQYVDVIIPRGGAALHAFCRDHSAIPVISGGIGVCHLYADATAHQDRSVAVIYNAKTQRPTVCNALDTLLVHGSIASSLVPRVIDRLHRAAVSFRLDERAWSIAQSYPSAAALSQAREGDWDREWLGLTLGIKIVDNLDEAIEHIRQHSTGHSDGILTETAAHADRFVREVDSAAVYVNASTRFTDGGQYGMGAEVAISTQKLHVRGPMGLNDLTSYKWIGRGDYAVRA